MKRGGLHYGYLKSFCSPLYISGYFDYYVKIVPDSHFPSLGCLWSDETIAPLLHLFWLATFGESLPFITALLLHPILNHKISNRITLFSVLVFSPKTSLRNCLTELKEQADSDGGFIGRTFEQLRDLYAEEHPQFFQQEDLDFEAPIKGQGLTEADEKSRRLQALKDFLSGRIETIVWDYAKSLRKKCLRFTQ